MTAIKHLFPGFPVQKHPRSFHGSNKKTTISTRGVFFQRELLCGCDVTHVLDWTPGIIVWAATCCDKRRAVFVYRFAKEKRKAVSSKFTTFSGFNLQSKAAFLLVIGAVILQNKREDRSRSQIHCQPKAKPEAFYYFFQGKMVVSLGNVENCVHSFYLRMWHKNRVTSVKWNNRRAMFPMLKQHFFMFSTTWALGDDLLSKDSWTYLCWHFSITYF